MKLLLLPTLFLFMAYGQEKTQFTLLHYNIKELTTEKISAGKSKQILEVKKELQKHQFDILSINEIQYDLPTVPSSKYQTKGRNLFKLASIIERADLKNETFAIANTGKNAKRNKQGQYFTESRTAEQRSHADQVNFGVFPAQYSTGAIYKFEKISEKVIADLKWKDFDTKIDLSGFQLANKTPLPQDIELFDKSFSDTTLKIHGKEVHLILLHTVPAFHFGNMKSVNYIRNKAQLDFLLWYLNLDGKSKDKAGISPLAQSSHFIVVGDLNVDFKSQNPGAETLKKIFANSNPWLSQEQMDLTHEQPDLMLDYIITSKSITTIEGKIIKNASKAASDHLPIWGKFEIN